MEIDPIERNRNLRRQFIKNCPECGSDQTDYNVPERGALGFYCKECDWSLGPYVEA